MSERLVFGSAIDGLLDRLYARNVAQNDALATYFTARAAEGSLDWNQFDERTNEFLRDKLIALDRAKAELCYHVCRALQARRVVEAGNHSVSPRSFSQPPCVTIVGRSSSAPTTTSIPAS